MLNEWNAHKTDLLRFYDTEADVYVANRPWMLTWVFTRMTRILLTLLKSVLANGHARVLNVGCGPGQLERSLVLLHNGSQSNNALFVSLDLSPNMARTTKFHTPYIEAVVADAESLPFRPSSFDAVISSRAIKFFRLHRFLDYVKGVLREGGLLLIIFDCGDAFWVKLLERVGMLIDVGIYSRTLDTKELVSLLDNSGFDVLTSYPVTSLPLSIFSYVPRSLYSLLRCIDVPRLVGPRLNIVLSVRRRDRGVPLSQHPIHSRNSKGGF
ncbi:class I SAM-dependent methyltransferase [Candidatus Bathyarchaeota archaeon]|nr:class I SAM-dependent methyltransferase [Candidatus Bathyarchaeota archaeon]